MTMIHFAHALPSANDLRARISIRGQLDLANLQGVFAKIKTWNEHSTTKLIQQYEEEEEADRRDLAQEQNRQTLQSMKSPEDVLRALFDMTKGTKSSAYLLNTFRHLLLIKEEGEERVRYFQLIDQLIQSIVMNDSPDLNKDFSRAFGISVQQVMGKFVEQQRMDEALQELKGLKARLAASEREKVDLLEEMAAGSHDLVSTLRAEITDLKEKLKAARDSRDNIQDQMEGQKRDYEQRIADLELYIQELFNMLRETNHLEEVQAMTNGPIDRRKLIHDLREKWERKKTIQRLEGRRRLGKTAEDVSEDEDEAEVEDLGTDKAAKDPRIRTPKAKKTTTATKSPSADRSRVSGSQFLDAEEDHVRAHIENSLAQGADKVVSSLSFGQWLTKYRRPFAFLLGHRREARDTSGATPRMLLRFKKSPSYAARRGAQQALASSSSTSSWRSCVIVQLLAAHLPQPLSTLARTTTRCLTSPT